jgi:hypothetical protein
MKKISTLYKKNPENLALVINELDESNAWVLENSTATRKFDGTASAIIESEPYKRYDVKAGRQVPLNAIPCQEPDAISGHWPHWVKCDRTNNADKFHFEAFDKLETIEDGTYELCGPKVQGNPENFTEHVFVKHGSEVLDVTDYSFEGLRKFLENNDIEGIVFHENGGDRMCKIRKTDYGIKR